MEEMLKEEDAKRAEAGVDAGGDLGAEGREDDGAEMVPVGESIRYRRRAQEAESRLREVEAECRTAREALEEAEGALASAERGREMDRLLVEAEAVDLEAARLLTEASVMAMDEEDVALAVEDLRRRKPYLFGRRSSGGGAMAARGRAGAGEAEEAAEAATLSGSRCDLLRYLRLRRTPELRSQPRS
ncbi:MAG: hypothetical protein ACYTGQ_08175 [Planctomycetota bacterium]|jgi:hypothetical protein